MLKGNFDLGCGNPTPSASTLICSMAIGTIHNQNGGLGIFPHFLSPLLQPFPSVECQGSSQTYTEPRYFFHMFSQDLLFLAGLKQHFMTHKEYARLQDPFCSLFLENKAEFKKCYIKLSSWLSSCPFQRMKKVQ